MESTYAIGQYLTLVEPNVEVYYRFQNFWINETVPWVNGEHTFMPFVFSGMTVDRDGGNIDCNLVFPNNQLSRDWGARAIEGFWFARIRTVLVDTTDKSVEKQRLLYNYTGAIGSGAWTETALEIRLNSILDAVGTDVPNRRLSRVLCGHLPVTSSVLF